MKDYAPHPYQVKAIEKMAANPGAAMLLDPGMGKTAIALASLTVFQAQKVLKSMLVIAPLRPMYLTWPAEVAKWTQFSHLKVSIIHGTPAQRIAAIKAKADVYLINPENIDWLVNHVPHVMSPVHVFADRAPITPWGTQPKMLVVDESTRFKNPSAKRFHALRTMLPMFDRAYILTGTPTPQSIADLFSQMQIVDGGERLGRFITHFRKLYMVGEEVRVGGGRTVVKWHPKEDAADRVFKRISDVTLRLQAEDYLSMPKLTTNTIRVELPKDVMKTYKQLMRDLHAKLEAGAILSAATAAAALMKLRQVANGLAYDADQQPVLLHKAKLDALADLVEEQSGQPLLVAVAFLPEVGAIREALRGVLEPDQDVPYLGGGVSRVEADRTVERWNKGELPVLLVHPTSVAHGLNLQAGGHAVCWFGLTWNLEEYLQCNARVYRQGQDKPVVVHHIVAVNTVDEDIAEALISKGNVQSTLLNRLKKDI